MQSRAGALNSPPVILVSAVLLDLDGTLVDTAPDMAAALNQLLAEENKAPMAYPEIRPHVSQGTAGLLGLAWARQEDEDRFAALKQRFLEIYAELNGRQSVLFDGFAEILDWFDGNGIAWGIVTNKPGWLTEPLLRHLGIDRRSGCLVCGDTLAQRKPHPAPLLHAAGVLDAAPQACVYVGDASRDMAAAESANMAGIVAAYGYIPTESDPSAWPAAAMIEKPGELTGLIGLK
ncbi:MAG: phosphoglycolate phosphatase [Proteobacteria bacterium]|nr:phosphoglycolate phosphatase [Pseudomonadota bacterium]